jgi:hypothetical protein
MPRKAPIIVKAWIAGYCLNAEAMEAASRHFGGDEEVAAMFGWSEAMVEVLRKAKIDIDIVPIDFRVGDNIEERYIITNFIDFGFEVHSCFGLEWTCTATWLRI